MLTLWEVWVLRRKRKGGPAMTCRVYPHRRQAVRYGLRVIRWHEVEQVMLRATDSVAQTIIHPVVKGGA